MTLGERIERLDWEQLGRDLDERGYAQTPALLTPAECDAVAQLYETGAFRKRVDMGQHQYGEGEYKYFDHPLPDLVVALRQGLYPHLAEVANRWAGRLKRDDNFPLEHAALLDRCRENGQVKP